MLTDENLIWYVLLALGWVALGAIAMLRWASVPTLPLTLANLLGATVIGAVFGPTVYVLYGLFRLLNALDKVVIVKAKE